MVMMSDHSTIRIAAHTCGPAVLLVTEGVLDSRTYRQLRDVIIKAALDVPAAVLVDVSGLVVPASSAWSVFTSARWHVSVWPDVPILLICADAAGRAAITANGVARYVPVYAARTQAFDAISTRCGMPGSGRVPICWRRRTAPRWPVPWSGSG
jgi:hypothetical protein